MNVVLIIEFDATDNPVWIQGLRIIDGFAVERLHSLLGSPCRIDTGEIPAPVGHRNNHIHVYDELGLSFIEHHYTRLIQNCCVWFDVEEREYRFTPRNAYHGKLLFHSVQMPLGGSANEFLQRSPMNLTPDFGNVLRYESNDYSLFVTTRGSKLPSGRRSKSLKVINVDISWPHDDWKKPD